jgi:hypothetical protein
MSHTFVFPLDRSSTYISLVFTGIDRVSFRLVVTRYGDGRVSVGGGQPVGIDLVLRHHLVSQEPFSDALNEFLAFRV